MNMDTSSSGGSAHESEDEFVTQVESLRFQLERCAAMLTGDLDEAVNLAQSAITKAWESRGQYQTARPLYPWVRSIVVNLSKQYMDRRRRHAKTTDAAVLSEVPQSSGQRNGVLSEILKNEVTVRMALAIGELPIPYREAFVLHYVEGMEYSEMAVLLGETVTALRTRAMRARGLLQSSLGPVVDTWMRG